jgi:hypothetical protein
MGDRINYITIKSYKKKYYYNASIKDYTYLNIKFKG